MKTNKEKNQEFDTKQKERVRPKGAVFNWQPLEAVIRQWILNKQ
jgi:hypothetical protein